MIAPKGKLVAIGGAEDKGTDLEKGEIHRDNLNFFELPVPYLLKYAKTTSMHLEKLGVPILASWIYAPEKIQ